MFLVKIVWVSALLVGGTALVWSAWRAGPSGWAWCLAVLGLFCLLWGAFATCKIWRDYR